MGTTQASARGASSSLGGRSSESPSPARSSKTRPSCCWTRPPPLWTRKAKRLGKSFKRPKNHAQRYLFEMSLWHASHGNASLEHTAQVRRTDLIAARPSASAHQRSEPFSLQRLDSDFSHTFHQVVQERDLSSGGPRDSKTPRRKHHK